MTRPIVGMLSSYGGLAQCDWLWKQSPEPFGIWGHMQLHASDPQPDYLLLYQFNFSKQLAPPPKLMSQQVLSVLQTFNPASSNKLVENAQSPLPPQFSHVPQERIAFLLREPPLPEVRAQNLLNYAYAQDHCGYVSGPDDSAPTPDYMPAIWYVNASFRELNEAPPPEKHSPCSWITSGINRTESHHQRLNFLKDLQASGVPVEIYGRNLPPNTRTVGELNNKWAGMAPYTYNLAIENYADNDWYVSEKLWDALLSWCLPIYYGGGAADKLLPPGSFLRLPSLDEKGIEYIREVTASPDAWLEARDAIAEARQVILHKLNLMNWLSEWVQGAG
ncbi:glycosyltransferase [Nodosilinea sp. LEGE 07088]|uniref:glycosyltransferase family 10 domain-containing protein n=1 Tax=Nodosilinea sp. LEGE 07088 TaxID=2777968 RepID=UPI001881AA06|nr:glycosyltransferase family 10 [Nodosilinea sp. LEGE 07088]MBE9140981.1 glycosyltransferase [Nodosilinea sp. LEGE 07088]